MEEPREIAIEPLGGTYGFVLVGNAPVYIQSLEAGAPAERAGVRIGDRIMGVNGVNVASCKHTQVISLIRKARPPVRLVLVSAPLLAAAAKQTVGRSPTSPQPSLGIPVALLSSPLIAALTFIPKIGLNSIRRHPRQVTEVCVSLCPAQCRD